VGAVSYLNTKPLIYGFEHGEMTDQLELIYDYPSKIASQLLNNEIDLGLVPVAIIPKLEEHHIITDYCIGADGSVGSVCLFSDVPVDEIEKVLLDYQSRTSVALIKILLKDYWRVQPAFVDARQDFRLDIKGTTAAVVIGDRAFQQRKISKFIYDMGRAWKELTGLPFVFASWISTKKLPDDFVSAFNAANGTGFKNLDNVLNENECPLFDLKEYYTKYISYNLDERKKSGLKLFLNKLPEIS
jgi:chorismate dehydratase